MSYGRAIAFKLHFLAKKKQSDIQVQIDSFITEKVFQIDTLGIVEQTKIAKKWNIVDHARKHNGFVCLLIYKSADSPKPSRLPPGQEINQKSLGGRVLGWKALLQDHPEDDDTGPLEFLHAWTKKSLKRPFDYPPKRRDNPWNQSIKRNEDRKTIITEILC